MSNAQIHFGFPRNAKGDGRDIIIKALTALDRDGRNADGIAIGKAATAAGCDFYTCLKLLKEFSIEVVGEKVANKKVNPIDALCAQFA